MRKLEEWKFVPSYEGLYMVSNLGRVKSLITGRILKPGKTKTGYLQVVLYKDGKRKHFFVHRLVALAFITNDENKPCINHKDYNRQNNCVENLEWATYKENNEYSGTIEKWWKAGVEVLKKPVEAYKDGELVGVFCSIRECARQLGLFNQSINYVLKGRYSHTGGFTFKYAD